MAGKTNFLVAILLFGVLGISYADESQVHVKFFKVYSQIYSRFATTLITSLLANPTNESQEIRFTATLPEAAFISNFSMEIGDKINLGDVKEKERAQSDYEQAKSRGQSTALVAQKARETNSFTIYANVAAYDKVTFNLTYQEILVRTQGSYRHVVNVRSDKLESSSVVEVLVEIFEQGKIVNVHVPRFSEKVSEKTNAELMKAEQDTSVQQSTTELAGVSTAKIYLKVEPARFAESTVSSELVVLYDIERDNGIGQIQVYDGYFVHFFAPKIEKKLNKRIVFVLDKSGSMAGLKIQQTKTAMKRILRELQPDDLFNIVVFDHEFTVWNEEMMPASAEAIDRAINYVDAIEAEGGTNICDSLEKAVELFNASKTDGMVPMIILMTDGEATDGKYTVYSDIVRHITEKNRDLGVVVHSVAFGQGADFRLMQGLSSSNRGLARKVYYDSDADLQMTGFYAEISSPLLSGVKFEYLNNTVDVSSLVHENQQYYYDGGELMVLGKLADNAENSEASSPPSVVAEVKANMADGQTVLQSDHRNVWRCAFPEVQGQNSIAIGGVWSRPRITTPRRPQPTTNPVADASTVGGFIERMWAFKTIKNMLKSVALLDNQAEKTRLKQEALRLSLKFRFVTEMTSMVVITQSDAGNTTTSELGTGDGRRVSASRTAKGGSGRRVFSSYRGSSRKPGLTKNVSSSSKPCNLHILVVVVKSDNVSIVGEVQPVITRITTSTKSKNGSLALLIVNEQHQPTNVFVMRLGVVNPESVLLEHLSNSSDTILQGNLHNVLQHVHKVGEKRLLIWVSSNGQPAASSSLYNELTTSMNFLYVTKNSSPTCD